MNIFNKDKLAYIYSTNGLLTETLASHTDSFLKEAISSIEILEKVKNNKLALSIFNNNRNLLEFYSYNINSGLKNRHLVKEGFLKFYNLRKDFFSVIRKRYPVTLFNELNNDKFILKNASVKDSPPLFLFIKKSNNILYFALINYSPLAKIFSKSKMYKIKLVDKYGNILFDSRLDNTDNRKIQNLEIIHNAKQSNLKTSVKEYKTPSGKSVISSYSKTQIGD
jgi:hypothetical protein